LGSIFLSEGPLLLQKIGVYERPEKLVSRPGKKASKWEELLFLFKCVLYQGESHRGIALGDKTKVPSGGKSLRGRLFLPRWRAWSIGGEELGKDIVIGGAGRRQKVVSAKKRPVSFSTTEEGGKELVEKKGFKGAVKTCRRGRGDLYLSETTLAKSDTRVFEDGEREREIGRCSPRLMGKT